MHTLTVVRRSLSAIIKHPCVPHRPREVMLGCTLAEILRFHHFRFHHTGMHPNILNDKQGMLMIVAFTELSATRYIPFRTDLYCFAHKRTVCIVCVFCADTVFDPYRVSGAMMRIEPDSFRPWQIQGSLTACALSGGLLFMSDDLRNLE